MVFVIPCMRSPRSAMTIASQRSRQMSGYLVLRKLFWSDTASCFSLSSDFHCMSIRHTSDLHVKNSRNFKASINHYPLHANQIQSVKICFPYSHQQSSNKPRTRSEHNGLLSKICMREPPQLKSATYIVPRAPGPAHLVTHTTYSSV